MGGCDGARPKVVTVKHPESNKPKPTVKKNKPIQADLDVAKEFTRCKEEGSFCLSYFYLERALGWIDLIYLLKIRINPNSSISSKIRIFSYYITLNLMSILKCPNKFFLPFFNFFFLEKRQTAFGFI